MGEGVGGGDFSKESGGDFSMRVWTFFKRTLGRGGRFFKRRGEGVRKYFKGGGGRFSKEHGGDFSKESRGGIFQWRAGTFFKRELGVGRFCKGGGKDFLKGSGDLSKGTGQEEIFQRKVGGGDFSKEGRGRGHICIRRGE